MGVTNYYTVEGEIIGESAGGVRTDYVSDALGSVVATVDSSSNLVNTYSYKPYGSLLSKTGTGADPSFLWVGTNGVERLGSSVCDYGYAGVGYSSTLGCLVSLSTRARREASAGSSIAQFWRGFRPSSKGRTAQGKVPQMDAASCGGYPGSNAVNGCISTFCSLLASGVIKERVQGCIDDLNKTLAQMRQPQSVSLECLQGWCASGVDLLCGMCPDHLDSNDKKHNLYPIECSRGKNKGCVIMMSNACAYTNCPGKVNPTYEERRIHFCLNGTMTYYKQQCPDDHDFVTTCGGAPIQTALHELGHVCSCEDVGFASSSLHRDPYNRFGKCLRVAAGCSEPVGTV